TRGKLIGGARAVYAAVEETTTCR
ncbi:TIGR01440 family protein, partial [Priestia megaterium]|nr:TIGR01440 family protein [Priestia megaterium]